MISDSAKILAMVYSHKKEANLFEV